MQNEVGMDRNIVVEKSFEFAGCDLPYGSTIVIILHSAFCILHSGKDIIKCN